MNAIIDCPFASEEIFKGNSVLRSKKVSGHDSVSSEMIKESLPSSTSSFIIYSTRFYKLGYTQKSDLVG